MNELMHYGVLGMKWGIRRYQNKNGTLTAEGVRHYASRSKIPYKKLKNSDIKKINERKSIQAKSIELDLKIARDKKAYSETKYGKGTPIGLAKSFVSGVWSRTVKSFDASMAFFGKEVVGALVKYTVKEMLRDPNNGNRHSNQNSNQNSSRNNGNRHDDHDNDDDDDDNN